MKRSGFDQITWQQREAANYGRSTKGDDEVLEDIGIPTSPESLLRHVQAGAEVARVLGIDTRTPRERARGDAEQYYAEQFHLTGPLDISDEQRAVNEAGALLARTLLEHRRDPPS